MKKLSFLFLVFISGIAVFNSCNPDSANPSADARDNYIGSWRVSESGKGRLTYEVQISADPNNSAQVLIKNFYNFGVEPYCLVTQGNITLPSQSFSKFITVYGSGTLNGSTITWTYYVNNGADLDTIKSTYTKL